MITSSLSAAGAAAVPLDGIADGALAGAGIVADAETAAAPDRRTTTLSRFAADTVDIEAFSRAMTSVSDAAETSLPATDARPSPTATPAAAAAVPGFTDVTATEHLLLLLLAAAGASPRPNGGSDTNTSTSLVEG